MSGWDAYDWAGVAFATVMILVGLVSLFRPGWQLRDGNRGADLKPVWPERLNGIAIIGLGVLYLLDLGSFPRRPGFLIAFGAFAMAVGSWMLFFEARFRAWRRSRYEARLADRHARGKDAYFEELREIEAYPPDTGSPPMQRAFGLLFVILGASQIAVGMFGAGAEA